MRGVSIRPYWPAIQPHRHKESGKEGYSDDGAPNGGAGAVHESEYSLPPQGSDRLRQR